MEGDTVDLRRRWADRLPDVEVLGWGGAGLWVLDIVAAATHTLDSWWVIAANLSWSRPRSLGGVSSMPARTDSTPTPAWSRSARRPSWSVCTAPSQRGRV
jgi:hypothetical protein